MIEVEAPDGSVVEFPDGTTDDIMAAAMRKTFGGGVPAGAQPAPVTPSSEELDAQIRAQSTQPLPTAPSRRPEPQGDTTLGVARAGMDGIAQGVGMLVDAPVHLVNQAPRALNLNGWLIDKIAGRQVTPSFGPITDNPVTPSDLFLKATNTQYREPQGPIERGVNRVGQELGASAVPAVGAIAAGGRMGVEGARALARSENLVGRIMGRAAETGAVNPAGLIGREASNATAAGLGAAALGEVANQADAGTGTRMAADFGGSIGGVAALSLARPIVGAASNMVATAFGSTKFADDVAREAVANEILANSAGAQRQVASGVDRGAIDSAPLANDLRRPSQAERVIPGYQSDIADRANDPGLAAYVFGNTAANPGRDTLRRAGNQAAVEARMAEMQPTGSSGAFREALQTGVDNRVRSAEDTAAQAQRALEEATQRLTATMTGEARGADIRAALQNASDRARAGVAEAYAPINQSRQEVDIAPLAERYGNLNSELSEAERARMRPAEAGIPQRLVGPAEAPGPVDTGLLDASGQPITREPRPGNSQQPIREVTGLRSALTDDARAARSANRPAEARIIDQHVTQLDEYLDQAVPPALREQYDAARAARRDFGDRFERPQNAVTQVLSERQGVYDVPDSGVAGRFAQGEEGRLTDLQMLMREAGGDARVRPALRDQFLANIRDRGLLDRPDQLNAYLDRHATLLEQLPGLRDELQAGGAASRGATEARTAADTTTRDLTTPGRSPEASYLRYDVNRDVDAIRSVVNNARPAEAARQILETAGGNQQDARAALWSLITKETTTQGGVGASGRAETNGLKGAKLLNDPKFDAVARELYRDNPEQLQDLKDVFSALAGSNMATRAKRPGSSGTPQGMKAGYEAALSASSIASRVRSINRGQLSPTIAFVDLAATALRRRSAQIQSGAISRLRDEVIQNPELAAKLLDDYNPADFVAKRREIQSIAGVRGSEVVKLLDMAHDEQERPEATAVRRASGGR